MTYTYFEPGKEPEFPGEMPIPDPVGDSDSGVSSLKANADHTHLYEIGGVTNPWQAVLFGLGWYNWNVNNRDCEYSRIGSVSFLRGVFGAPNPAGFGIVMGTIPIDYCPRSGKTEVIGAWSAAGACEVWIQSNGSITWHGPSTNPQWVTVGNIYWSID
jgi:hypothetical protein